MPSSVADLLPAVTSPAFTPPPGFDERDVGGLQRLDLARGHAHLGRCARAGIAEREQQVHGLVAACIGGPAFVAFQHRGCAAGAAQLAHQDAVQPRDLALQRQGLEAAQRVSPVQALRAARAAHQRDVVGQLGKVRRGSELSERRCTGRRCLSGQAVHQHAADEQGLLRAAQLVELLEGGGIAECRPGRL